MEEICKLFMEENDKQALEKLYELTNDKLCKILLYWLDMEEMTCKDTNEYQMYEDIMSYLWEKYNIGGE